MTVMVGAPTFLQPWVGGVVCGAAVLVGVAAWFVRRRTPAHGTVLAAGLARVRALPGFGALVRAQVRSRGLEVACLVLALVGVALMAARWVGVDDDSPQMRSRDVVLCLDVSGSMAEVDTDVLETYQQIAARLDGERIGFVMFDGNAVTGFPLTDDYPYVRTSLQQAADQINQGQVAGTLAARAGSSLIGDGLASCVQHFDRPEEDRSRTIVLATDNLLSGDSIYSLPQATDLARAAGVMVYGIVPLGNRSEATSQLRTQTRRTGGDVLQLDPTSETNTVVISEAVTSQQKKVIVAESREQSFDRVWPGGLLLGLGLAGSLAVSAWGARTPRGPRQPRGRGDRTLPAAESTAGEGTR